ncbi:MAG: TfuA-like protein [Myxococcota bacterium]
MRDVIVFSGPTLSPARVGELLVGATCRGPAACGDVYRATSRRPRAIVVIDGYFDHTLSIWHKELHWALSQGIRVYGAASMGAIRAAEMAELGMVGVGWIYEAFRAGTLEDDDEVAVSHGDEGQGYRAQSVPMVNIRATLRAALHEGALDSGDEARLIAAAKALYYPDRSFAAILTARSQVPFDRLARIRDWLQHHGVVDQKAIDAAAAVARVQLDLTSEAPPVETPRFVVTSNWTAFCTRAARSDLA